MPEHSEDIAYACAQLGLAADASFVEIRSALARAELYRFSTRARINHMRRFVEFFAARDRLGGFDVPFADIRKAYRRKAMELHPDRNAGDKASEDALKEINNDYALIEKIYQQARIFYKRSEDERRDIEQQARETTLREAGEDVARQPPQQPKDTAKKTSPPYRGATTKKYMAASVPRSIRTARLGYLPLDVIIGSRSVKRDNDIAFIFDYFMLPEDQFLRAKSYLSLPETINPALQYGKFNPPFVLKDTKEVVVPEGVDDAEAFAREYFKQEFGI